MKPLAVPRIHVLWGDGKFTYSLFHKRTNLQTPLENAFEGGANIGLWRQLEREFEQ